MLRVYSAVQGVLISIVTQRTSFSVDCFAHMAMHVGISASLQLLSAGVP